MKYWKVYFVVILVGMYVSVSLSTVANAGDEKLKGYFVNCFLSEKDLGNTMVLYRDERIQNTRQGGSLSGFENLLSGYRAWHQGGHVFFTHFEENRNLYRSQKAAEKHYWGLVANNSVAKKPARVIRGEFGDVCNVWVYPVGDLKNPDEYFTKYYILEKNLITMIRASQKPLPKGTVVYDGLLERISPYIRLALIKSSMLLRYYDTSAKGNLRPPVSSGGLNVRRYKKTQ